MEEGREFLVGKWKPSPRHRFNNLCRGIFGKANFRTPMCMHELYMVVHELSLAHV